MLLHVAGLERRDLAAPQPAAEQHGQNGTVANAFHRRSVGSIQQTLRLGVGEPVASALAVLGDTPDAADADNLRDIQQAEFARFLGQRAHGSQALVDSGRRVPVVQQR
jgi:hypothetical protein